MGDTANPGEATGQDPRWLRGNPLGCGAQAAGGWGSSDRRALVLLTAGEGRGRAPPLPELPMGHRVALSVGAVTPSVLSWLTFLRPVFVLHRLQDVSVSPRASREAPALYAALWGCPPACLPLP